MTDPEQAVEFVKQTKIDALAVAIGNAHGQPSANEHLDFDRLKRIRRLVSRPLVLHGASGTPPKDIKRAISNGICKINIDTDLRLAFSQTLRRTIKLHPGWIDPRALLLPSRDSLTNLVKQKIVLFKSHRQAK